MTKTCGLSITLTFAHFTTRYFLVILCQNYDSKIWNIGLQNYQTLAEAGALKKFIAQVKFLFVNSTQGIQDKVNSADSAFILLIKSKSMVRLIRAEKMVLSGLVFARNIARMILIQNI